MSEDETDLPIPELILKPGTVSEGEFIAFIKQLNAYGVTKDQIREILEKKYGCTSQEADDLIEEAGIEDPEDSPGMGM